MIEPESNVVTVKTPKKVLHFSDGVLEIYDDDEEKNSEVEINEPDVDEVSLIYYFINFLIVIRQFHSRFAFTFRTSSCYEYPSKN